MKAEAGEDPNHVYPLRDVESQFRVRFKQGPEERPMGSLSHSQLMRECYPGAVYYYTTRPFRVYKVSTFDRTVFVRRERRYTTSPVKLPTMVFPNLASGNIYQSIRAHRLVATECNIQVREAISGIKERRGPNEVTYSYPLDASASGIYFDRNRFTHNYFTTGVILTHEALDLDGLKPDMLCSLIYEAFLMVVPFERRDINYATDRHRIKRRDIAQGRRFLCLYDQTYGSLRLTSRLLEHDILVTVLDRALELASYEESEGIEQVLISVLKELSQDAKVEHVTYTYDEPGGETESQRLEDSSTRVMLKDSLCVHIDTTDDYIITSVFMHPDGLRYLVKPADGPSDEMTNRSFPIEKLQEVPGMAKWGCYSYDTGECIPEDS